MNAGPCSIAYEQKNVINQSDRISREAQVYGSLRDYKSLVLAADVEKSREHPESSDEKARIDEYCLCLLEGVGSGKSQLKLDLLWAESLFRAYFPSFFYGGD